MSKDMEKEKMDCTEEKETCADKSCECAEEKETCADKSCECAGEKDPDVEDTCCGCDEKQGCPGESDECADQKSEEDKDEEPIREQYMRLMAEFQNYKKRVEKERGDIHAFANEKIITDLLEVLDNFERAFAAEETDNFKEGMEMIFNQLKDVLTRAGMEEIQAENQDFDPNVHNAVLMEEAPGVESGKVSEVLQKGYTLNGRVIRASMVKVAK